MNLRSKIVIITLMAVVAIVGVGYATWTFNTEVNASVTGVTGKVAASIVADDVKVTKDGSTEIEHLYIICSKPDVEGIFWSTTADGSDPIEQLKLVGSVDVEERDFVDFATYTGSFDCTFAGKTDGAWVNIPAKNVSNATVTSTSADGTVVYVYTLPTLTYKQSVSSLENLDSLQTEVNGLDDLTFSFSFKVVSVTQA